MIIEVKAVLAGMKKNRALGLDKIPNDAQVLLGVCLGRVQFQRTSS